MLRNKYSDAAVVQLVRISACHAEGRGFESRPLRHFSSPEVENVYLKQVFSCIIKTTALFLFLRALSSVGRASALQAECRRFDPVSAHHIFENNKKYTYYKTQIK